MPMILVCTPSHDERVGIDFMRAMLALGDEAAQHDIQLGFWDVSGWSDIAFARDVCVHRFLKSAASHLLFLDSDHSFSPKTIIEMLKCNKSLIGATYPRRELNAEQISEAARNGVAAADLLAHGTQLAVHLLPPGSDVEIGDRYIEVEGVGTGTMLIRRNVIERLVKAHPELAFVLDARLYPAFGGETLAALFTPLIVDAVRYGEDFSFCKRWRDIGGKVFAYLTSSVAHSGAFTFRCSSRQLVALREQAIAQRSAP